MSDFPTQSVRTVAYRALCLGTLLKRHALEVGLRSVDDLPENIREGWKREHEGIHLHLKKWLVDEKIAPYFSAEEQLLLDAELGEWQQLDRAKIYWRCESLGMVLWAMEVIEVPYYDTQFNAEALLEPLDLMSPTIDYIWQASLREAHVIYEARDLARNWYHRAQFTQQDNKTERIQELAHAMYSAGNLPDVIDDDFPVLGKAYHQLTDREYQTISSIAKERYYALQWLCGEGDDWDDVPIGSDSDA